MSNNGLEDDLYFESKLREIWYQYQEEHIYFKIKTDKIWLIDTQKIIL